MYPADHRGDHMAAGQVEIVTWAIEIGRYDSNEVFAVLTPIGLAELHTGNLSYRVPFISRFKGSGQQTILADGLFSFARIEAGRAEKHQLTGVTHGGRMDNISGNQ